MARKSLGVLTLDLVARTGGFVQGMDKAERSSAKWRRQVEKDMKVVKDRTVSTLKAGAASATVFAVATAALTKKGLEAVESQARFAKSLGTTYDSVTQLRAAFGDSGIDDFEASMNRLNRRLGAAELGRGAAVNAVKELKLDLQELAQVDAAERVAIIADRIKDVATNSQTAARYAQDLGFEQREAASFFLQGGDAVRAYSEEIEALGLSLSDIDAQKVIDAQNAMGAFGDITTAVSQKLASNFAPLLKAASEELNNVAIEAGGVGVVVDDVFDRAVVGGIRTAASFRTVFNQLTSSLGDIWSGYQSLPPWAQEIGIVGALVGGKKGVLLVAAVAKAAEDTKVTAAWFAAYTQGDVGFFEWLSSGHGEAKDKLKELGYDVDEIKAKAEGPSIIGSLFGVDDKDNDEWADNMIARYRRIQEESRKSAEQAMKDWQEMRDGLGSGGGPSGGGAIDLVANEITALERAAKVWGMSADEVKLYDLTVQGATDSQLMQARALQETVAGFEESKASQEAYLTLVQDLRTDEEKLTDQLYERLAVLDKISDATDQDYSRAAAAAFGDAPSYGGLAPEVGGPLGELDKLDDAQEKLQEWYDTQLEMLEEFRSERADLNAQWDEQEASLHQEHQDRLAEIERARQMVQLAAGEEFFGNLAGVTKAFFGEQSGLYKAAFALEQSYAVAKAILAAPEAYTSAYKAVVGIPVVGPALAPAAGAVAAGAMIAQAAIASSVTLGQAHEGLDEVPETGPYTLLKGERVTTAETSAKLDATLDRVLNGERGGSGTIVNIHNAPPGTRTEESQGLTGEQVIDIWLADFNDDGRTAQAVFRRTGTEAQGR